MSERSETVSLSLCPSEFSRPTGAYADVRRRLGIEGLITFSKDTHTFDAENYTISVPGPSGHDVVISVFDKIEVEVSIEKDKNTQRGKVKVCACRLFGLASC